MDDDFENMCPLCVLPFNEQDMLFRPCGCGFRICSWCWHKIVDDAGQAGESTVDTIAKCPNCREPFDVASTLEQQAKNNAIIVAQNKSKPKRKACAAKQGVVDNVYVDGKSVVMRNVPSDAFFPLVLRRLRDKHIETYEKEIAATHGSSGANTSEKKKSSIALNGEEEEDEEDETFATALVEDSSDEDEADGPLSPNNVVLMPKVPTSAGYGSTTASTAAAAAAAAASAAAANKQPLPTPFPFAAVPPCRSKKDIAEVLKTIVMSDHLTAVEDHELVKLIVDRRNDFPYQHVYSCHTDRLEHLSPFLVAPTLEQLQQVVGIPSVEGSILPSSDEPYSNSGFYGGGSSSHNSTNHHSSAAAAAALAASNTSSHSPLATGYPPRAPTLGRNQLVQFGRYESDLWSWVEHFLTPTSAPAPEDDPDAEEEPVPATTVTSSAPYWNHSFFDSWVPCDGSSRTARRAFLTAEALKSPMVPPALAAALAARNAAAAAKSNAASGGAVATKAAAAAAATATTAAEDDEEKPDGWDVDADAADEDDETAAVHKEYRLLRATAAPPLFTLDDALASLTIEQVVADLPVLTYSAVEALVTQAINAHKVRGQGPTAIGGFVQPSTLQQFVSTTSKTNSNAAFATAGPCVFPSAASILSSVLVVLMHRRRQWYRWVTELVAAADNCVRDTINKNSNGEAAAQLRLQHLLPAALRQQQNLIHHAGQALLTVTAAAAAAASSSPAGSPAAVLGRKVGILDRGGAPSSAGSTPATPEAQGGAAGSADEAVPATSAAQLGTNPIASKAYLLTFGIALINYLGIKEGVCLTDVDRLRFLRSYGSLGKYGTVTDIDIYLQECHLLLNVKPDVKQYRKALQQAAASGEEIAPHHIIAAGGGGASASAAAASAGANVSSSAPTSGASNGNAAALSTEALIAEAQPKERKWPEELMRTMLFKSTPVPTTAAEAALLSATADSLSNEIHLLPCQYYWIALRFNAVGEAVQCVLKGTEELFPSWLGYSAGSAGGDGDGEDDSANAEANNSAAGVNRSPGSASPTASGNAINLYLAPTRRISLIPRRPTVIGLVPTRYCGSYLKHAPCKKQFCVELHNDVSGKNAIMLTSTSPATLVKNIQKHFFTPYLEADATTVAVGSGDAMMARQGSSSCFLLAAAATSASSASNTNALQTIASTSMNGGLLGGMERQSSSIVFGAAAAAVATASSTEVKGVAPLHLKMIKAGDISAYGGDLLVTSPLLQGNTASTEAVTDGGDNHGGGAADAFGGSGMLSHFSEDPAAPLKGLVKSITEAFSATSSSSSPATATTAAATAATSLLLSAEEQSAQRVATKLLAVGAAIINTLLAQDNASARAQVSTYAATQQQQQQQTATSSNSAAETHTNTNNGKAIGGKGNHHHAMPPPPQQQHTAFVSMQLAALAFQCAAGATGSDVTSGSLGGANAQPSEWIGFGALQKALNNIVSANESISTSTSTAASVDLFASFGGSAGASASIPIDERRALLLAVLPETTALLHMHLGTLLGAIMRIVNGTVHGNTIAANHKYIIGKARDAAAARAEALATGKAGGLTVLRNSNQSPSSSISSPVGLLGGSTTSPSSSPAAGGENLTALLMAEGNGRDGGVAAASTLASLNAAIRMSSVPAASALLQSLQTSFVALTRLLQILRQLSDTLALSATLLQLQQANANGSSTGDGDDQNTAAGGNNAKSGGKDNSNGGASAAHSSNANSTANGMNSTELLTAKALVQRANFVRVLFSSLQLFLQASLGGGAAVSNNGGEATTTSCSTTSSAVVATTTTNAATTVGTVRAANEKLKAQLAHQHLRSLQHLPAQLNLVPNTEDRDILVNNCTTILVPSAGGGNSNSSSNYHNSNNYGGQQQQQQQVQVQVQPAQGVHEVTSADQLGTHQLQLQSGVTPSSAISSVAATSSASAASSSRYGGGSSSSLLSTPASRSRTAGNALVTLVNRRARRNRRQLSNAFEMWSSFVPATVLDALDEETREDWLRAHITEKHLQQLQQQKKTVGVVSSVAESAAAVGVAATTASTPQAAVKHALKLLLLPHQIVAAVRYYQLSNTVAVAYGTSGVSVGTSAIVPNSLLTVGGVLGGSSASTSTTAVDAHGATVGHRIYADGLAWLRNIGTTTAAEVLLFQQLTSSSNNAVAAPAAAEVESAAAMTSHHTSASSASNSHSHGHSGGGGYGANSGNAGYGRGGGNNNNSNGYGGGGNSNKNNGSNSNSKSYGGNSNNSGKYGGNSNNNSHSNAHNAASAPTAAAAPAAKPANAWGTPARPSAPSAASTPTPAAAVSSPVPNAWGKPSASAAAAAPAALGVSPTPAAKAPAPAGLSPSPSPAPVVANAWGVKTPAPSAWGAAGDLPTLGAVASAPPVRSFASIVSSKK